MRRSQRTPGPPGQRPRRLTIAIILEWADAFRRRTGSWPAADSGPIPEVDLNWNAVNRALREGLWGLPGGSTLLRELRRHRGIGMLSEDQIFAWAQQHYRRTGKWPIVSDGAIPGSDGATWGTINSALTVGSRGLPGGSSLKQLLIARRAIPPEKGPLSPTAIWRWARAFHRQHGCWPSGTSGAVADAPGETWGNINQAMREGYRGFPGGSSLYQFLVERGAVPPRDRPLDPDQILAWADAFHQSSGRWPNTRDGNIAGAPGESWLNIHYALRYGFRGLPGASSLREFLGHHRGVASRDYSRKPRVRLSLRQITRWAREYFDRTGRWPHRHSGPIPGSGGFTWRDIDYALRAGLYGLRGGVALSRTVRGLHRVDRAE